jgi:hypothetical protein
MRVALVVVEQALPEESQLARLRVALVALELLHP